MATTYYNQIQQLYVAYFNRPADPKGLAYWEGVMEASKNTDATLKAITAQFSQEAEYKSVFAGMNNGQIIDKIYSNLFGRAPDAEGRAYWVGLMDSNKVTVDRAVADIAAAAKNQDLVTVQSKVAASVAFTAALDTQAEIDGYNTNSTGPAKTFLAGVTDAATLAAAIAPATLGATVAKVVAAGTTFSLASGLSALTIANQAKADFLAAADGDNDAKTSTTDAAITAKVTSTVTDLDTLVTGDYTNSSTGVRAALLSSQQALNAATLADAQTALNTANANIAKVAGLSAAIAVLESAKTAVTNATTADKAATVDLAAKLAAYNATNGTAVTVNADGTVAGLIEINSTTKALQLVSGVTETKNPGVTALLASSTALEAADAALTNANTAQVNAQKAVDGLDLTAAAQADLKDIGAAMTYVKLDTGATATTAQINTELGQLDAVQKSTKAIADQAGSTQAQKDAAAAAATAYNNFKALVDKFTADDNANPLIAAQTAATANVKTAGDTITALQKAVDAVSAANATAAQLAAVNGQVKAAGDAFINNNLVTPITLDADHVSNVATAGADIYVSGKTNASILNFGLLGSDSLYIGSNYTLNTGDYTKGAGNNSVLEAFIVKSGSDTNIVLEKSAFGSNAATPEIVTITLTGVDSTKVHLTNGIITVG